MIEVTRLNGTKLLINPHLLEIVEETPDTVLTLTTGHKIIVKESRQEIKNLVIALGTGVGETTDMNKLRYHKIILMTDADVDGEHIVTLSLTLFYRHLRHILDNGYLYVAQPPLFKIEVSKDEFYWVKNEEERDKMIAKLALENKSPKHIQRFKGLGEMNPEQLWETTMNPKTRVLKRIRVEDIEEADATFDLLMGNEVAPRKKFIQTHSKEANLDI